MLLVTGGLGFVGSNLVKYLSENTLDEIHVLDNLSSSSSEKIHGVKYHIGHTKDIKNILTSLQFDTVYHFGEYSRINTSFEDVKEVFESNLKGTVEVLMKCLEWKALFVYSATSSSFSQDCKNPYTWTKESNVSLIKNLSEWFGLKYQICYFYNVYGKGQIESGRYATVVGIFEKLKREGKPLTVVRPGTQERDFTHIEDIIDGIIKVTKLEHNKEFYLRSGKPIRILNLAKLFNSEIEYVAERKSDRMNVEGPEPSFPVKHNIVSYVRKLNLQ